jgi:hypothetical protein
MTLLPKTILLLCLIWVLQVTPSVSGSSDAEHFSINEIPIYRNAYNVEKYVDHATKSERLTYSVRTDNPAAEVIEFYDAYFNGIGWKSSFEICQRHWDESAVKDVHGKLRSKQLFTSWQAPETGLKASLWLISRLDLNNNADDLLVNFQITSRGDR